MISPYHNLGAEKYWKTAIAAPEASVTRGLYTRKFPINAGENIVTAGSCFAQHIGRALRSKGVPIVDVEPAPSGISPALANRFGYGIYSARYGNIYTARQLLQLILEAKGKHTPENWIWTKECRYYDALRPGVEPEGLGSEEEVKAHRQLHLRRIGQMFNRCDVLIFTLGLTEAWIDSSSGTVYPNAPGTICGNYDPEVTRFRNFTFSETYADLVRVRKTLRARRKELRIVLTVSPVPLTATASGNHVLAATVYSKSVLRAVAGQLSDEFEDVDYFPSYDVLASHPTRGQFYEDNLRVIRPDGVDIAMSMFMDQHFGENIAAKLDIKGPGNLTEANLDADEAERDVICEEMLLEAFAK